MDLRMISDEDVLSIHEALVADFAQTGDPIAPPGVRSMALLESAVSRQTTSLGGKLKHPDALHNAATLLYGICLDHPFHNGNKRTAVVAMLVHLDENKLALQDTTQKDLFDMIIAVATHQIGLRPSKRCTTEREVRRQTDEEVEAIAEWLRRRAKRVLRGERQITYRDLRRILGAYGYHLENPDRNYIEVVRFEEERAGSVFKRTRTVRKKIGSIGWPGECEVIGVREIKNIRRLCRLTEADGIDSSSFYDRAAVIDAFVNRYRTLLRRLARR